MKTVTNIGTAFKKGFVGLCIVTALAVAAVNSDAFFDDGDLPDEGRDTIIVGMDYEFTRSGPIAIQVFSDGLTETPIEWRGGPKYRFTYVVRRGASFSVRMTQGERGGLWCTLWVNGAQNDRQRLVDIGSVWCRRKHT